MYLTKNKTISEITTEKVVIAINEIATGNADLTKRINLKSNNQDSLPKTRTSKNGLREGDERLDALYSWIRSCMHEPVKDFTLSTHETDLFESLKQNMQQYNPDPNKIIDTEMHVFTSTGNVKDKVRIDNKNSKK
mgnify:CR=1 FL=1